MSPGFLGLAAVLAATAAPAAAQYTSFATEFTPPSGADVGVDDVVITPDGRFAIYRDVAQRTNTRVVDLATGQYVLQLQADFGPDCPVAGTGCSGPCNDALAATNERVISLGQEVKIIDLTAQPPVELGSLDCGVWPRDVALSDDGAFAIIRGGSGPRGGTYVVDMATGTQALFSPSEPRDVFIQLGNDLAGAADFHGVTLAYDDVVGETEILVVEFSPSGGGGPRVVFDSATGTGFAGDPMDVAISPDGQYATVRTSDQVVLLRLDGTNTAVVRTFTAFQGGSLPFGTAAVDTVVSSNSLWATFAIGDGSISDASVYLQDLQTGQEWFAFIDGTPRDLVMTPDGGSLLVHTGLKIYRFDLVNLPVTPALNNTTSRPFVATAAGIFAGIDSVEATNERAIVAGPEGPDTRVRVYDLTGPVTPEFEFGTLLQGRPIDVDIAEDGSFAVVVTQESYLILDLRTGDERLRVERAFANPNWPWSDGAAIHPDHVIVGGHQVTNFDGWVDTVDLVSRADTYCASLPNSTGDIGELFILGSTRVGANDLQLCGRLLPAGVPALFFITSGTNAQPLGGGIVCIGGSGTRLPMLMTDADGTASFDLDLTNPNVAGLGIVAGTTWYTQLAFMDTPAAGGFNYTSASSMLFE